MRLLVLLAAALLCALLALPAAPAAADDRSVKAAWDSEDQAFTELGRSVRREVRAWQRRGYTRDAKLLRLYRRGEELSRKVVAVVNAQQPSTPQGTDARNLAIASTSHFAEYFVAERRFVRRMRRGKPASARAAEREALRLDRLTRDEAKRAREIFASLGLT